MKQSILIGKRGTFAVLLLSIVLGIHSQSHDRNHIQTKIFLDNAGVNSQLKIDYFDGLGRPVETVLHKASPGLKDIVTLLEYDPAGRIAASHITTPVNSSTGAYVDPSGFKSASQSFYGDSYAFEQPVYEASPLERVTKHYGPGSAWQTAGKAILTSHHANSSSGELSCTLYSVASTSSLQRKGIYPAGELFVTKSTDEDGHVSYIFTDKQGKTVLERVMNGTIMNDTYYVYDELDNLRYVLPPAASDLLTATTTWTDTHATLSSYAYIYKYDGYNRCTRKVLPGCDSISMRYDKADRLVFSQDGERRKENQWLFFLYDAFGREVVKGVCPSQNLTSFGNTVVKATYDGGTTLGGYSVTPALTGTIKLMMVNYYDDYAFLDIPMTAKKDSLIFLAKGYDPQSTSAQGTLTGTCVYQLDDPAKFTVSAIYYDHRGRIVQQHSSNHLGGYDNEYFTYTFSGKVKQRMLVHSATSSTTRVETYYYNYGDPATNPAERLQDVKHKLSPNTAQAMLASYTYDDIGRIKTKKIGSETSTYSYNIRSWLSQISATKFNQTLVYNAPVNGLSPSAPRYNGNISAMKWKSGDETTERGYKFTYDGLDRLTTATYGEGANITSNLNNYNEAMTYNDKMGNIRTLVRRGKLNSGYGEIDNLTYTYTGNRLTKVTDAVTTPITYQGAFHFVDGANVPEEYTYDTNGNITKDLNRNITSITYNELNLPKVITMSGNKSVTYGYDAAGRKLSAVYKSGTTITTSRDYVGNKVYNNGTLGIVLTEEGYATVSGTPVYYYYLKDHQGNNRVVISQNGAVQEVNHYYPFGGLFGDGVQPSVQRYKYNGKELDREFGLDMYDYGARHYDAALGRWFTVDPMAEQAPGWTPYRYAFNNPIRYTDPTGMYEEEEDDHYFNEKGQYVYSDTRTTDNIRVISNEDWNEISANYGNEIRDTRNSYGNLLNELDAKSRVVSEENSGSKFASIWSSPVERIGHPVLNFEKATLTFEVDPLDPGATALHTTIRYRAGDKHHTGGVVLGNAHTHPTEHTYLGKIEKDTGITITDSRNFNNQYVNEGDGYNAAVYGPTYTISKYNVDYYSPLGKNHSTNNISTRSSLQSNQFKLNRNALFKYNGK